MRDDKVEQYFKKQKSPQKEICQKLRQIIFETFPHVKEEMKWGAAVYDGGRYYIGVVRYGVNFGFAISGLSEEEIKQFEGNGKTMRHIKIEAVENIDKEKLVRLMKTVKEKATCEE